MEDFICKMCLQAGYRFERLTAGMARIISIGKEAAPFVEGTEEQVARYLIRIIR